MMNLAQTQPCKKCGSAVRNKNGRCAECHRAAAALYRLNNPEKYKASQRAYCENNPEKRKESHRKYHSANKKDRNKESREWYAKNKDRSNCRSAEWRKNHPEMVRELNAEWLKNNPEKRAQINRNRRARKLQVGGSLSDGISAKLFKLQRGKCACCGLPLGSDYHLDHIMPLALGGLNTDDNIQLLRSTCNKQKHAKHPVDFMQSRGFLL